MFLAFGLGAILLRLSIIDVRTYRLPDRYTFPLILAGVLLAAFRVGGIPWDAIAGAAVGFGVFALIGAFFFRVRQVDGLGLGDAKLLGAAGAWLGLGTLPLVVLIAALGALITALAKGATRNARIAFGPWLAAAFWGLWVAQEVLQWI